MAVSKSVSKKATARKAANAGKSEAAAEKPSKKQKRRATGKKAAATRSGRVAAKKATPNRRTKAAGASRAKFGGSTSPAIAAIDERIAIVRNNLRELVEQATAYSGASNEELVSQRIAEQETKLEALKKQREEFSQRGA